MEVGVKDLEFLMKKACYKPKFATGSALEAYRTYSDLGGEL